MLFRHGDVIIKKVSSIQGNLKKTKDDVIVAEGEATGHAHRFKTEDGQVELYENDGTLYVKVLSEKAFITHEEHKPIEIPQGNYKILIQREYEPDGWRYVAD